ncbi:MAG: glycosyltransferase family 9 protein [Chloroflexota bacterium]|nr:glycosyltransferase family 9 protein [Chloroflexota bacterium]
MDRIRLDNQLPQRVVIVRALRGLGDLLCAVPAWRALRAALPEAEIALVALPEVERLVDRFSHYIDQYIEFPGYPGIEERPPEVQRLPDFFAAMHREGFDLALQMHGSGGTSNPFTIMLGARLSAGFFLPGEYCPDPGRFLVYPEGEPEVRRHLLLMEFLGIPLTGESLEFPLDEEDWSALQEIEVWNDLQQGAYVCIHPGARDPARRWPPECFAVVADALANQGLRVVLTGTPEERTLTEAVTRAMHYRPIDLAGRTSLGAVAALLSRARLLICNDTGVSHLAAALGTPSVVLFLDADPARWAPLDRERHRILDARGEVQMGSGYRAVPPEMVLGQAEALLWREDVRVA